MWKTAGLFKKTWQPTLNDMWSDGCGDEKQTESGLMWTHILHVWLQPGQDIWLWPWPLERSHPWAEIHTSLSGDHWPPAVIYFNYSQCSCQHRGHNLCSSISKLYSSSVSSGEYERRRGGAWQLTLLSHLPILGRLLILRSICLQAENLQRDTKHKCQLTGSSHVTIKYLL